jgi:Xaa-Pro aminopeptidase
MGTRDSARGTRLINAALALLLIRPSAAAGHQGAPDPAPAKRRAAAIAALGSRLAIVPSQAAFKTDDQAGFQQATDFYYLTGLGDVVGAALVLDGPGRSATLFMPAPNPVITRPLPAADPASARRLGLDAVLSTDSLAPWLGRRFPSVSAILVSMTDPRGAVRSPSPMANGVVRWAGYLSTLGWKGEVASAVTVIRPLREIKDEDEIAILERVGRMSGQAMLAGTRALRPGVTQRTVEGDIIAACIAAGGRHSFWPWAMSGPRGVYTDLFNSFVDYEGHDRAMRAGELVRVDVGCQADHYMGDVGRTVPVSGRFDPGQREAWDLFIAGYRAGLAILREGVRPGDVFRVALDRIRALQPRLTTALGQRAAESLLSLAGTEAWQFHHVGLDDAEGQPEVLRAGMTVAYELMFAVGDQGFYLEDMIVIEPGGYRLLTPGLPYTAREIEEAMRRPAGQ